MHLLGDQVVPLAAVATVFAIGVGLLALNPASRAIRGFALLLLLRGFVGLSLAMAGSADTPAAADVWWRLQPYLILALAPAALYFAAVFPLRRKIFGLAPFRLLVAATALLEAAYVFDHTLFWDLGSRPGGVGHPGFTASVGPLYLSQALFELAYAVLVWSATSAFFELRPGRARISTLLVALGFGLVVVYDGISFLTLEGEATWRHPPEISFTTALILAAAVGVVAFSAIRLVRDSRRAGDPDSAWLSRRFAGALLLAPASLALVAATSPAPAVSETLAAAFGSLWRLALPLLVAYGLARHHMFDIDLRVKRTIGKGAVAAVFLAVFFVVGQLAQGYLQFEYGWLAGSIAAGLLLFVLSPLQSFAERFADAAMPGTKPLGEMDEGERLAVYRDATNAVWADGAIDRNERAMLDRLRARLGIGAEDALRIESEAAKA